MKKLLAILLALVVVGGFAFAEDAAPALTFTMYGEPTATVLNNHAATAFDNYFETYINWSADDMGFSATVVATQAAPDYFAAPRNWKLYYKFFDGKVQLLGGDLRETGGLRLTSYVEGAGMSTRIANADKNGVMVTVNPIDGLTASAFVPMTGGKTVDEFKLANFGAAYTITDIAKIVAGYRQDNKQLWVGADIKAVKDVTLALGYTYTDGDSAIYATAGTKVGSLDLGLDAQVVLLSDMVYGAEVYAEYAMDPLAFGCKVAYDNDTAGDYWFGNDGVWVKPYLRRDFSNGNVNIAFTYNTGDSSFAIPLQFVLDL